MTWGCLRDDCLRKVECLHWTAGQAVSTTNRPPKITEWDCPADISPDGWCDNFEANRPRIKAAR